MNTYAMQVIGFRDGFRGLAEDRRVQLGKGALSGILTVGGTILGTSRDKPHKMLVDGQVTDMTPAIVETYRKAHLDAIVCLGGGGTQKNALRLVRAGLNVVTLPKTIDNDVALTDATFGFATALEIATEAIDRLHSTAHSHHRIIVAEVMGHRAGWLTLGAGLAGGADVILIPEIPYRVESIAEAIRRRSRSGTNFSIVAVAEGARSVEDAATFNSVEERLAATITPKWPALTRSAAALPSRVGIPLSSGRHVTWGTIRHRRPAPRRSHGHPRLPVHRSRQAAAPRPRRCAPRPSRADPGARAPHRARNADRCALAGRHPDRHLRPRLLLGCREELLVDPRRRDHGGGICRRRHAQPDLRGGLLGPDRSRRGGPRGL